MKNEINLLPLQAKQARAARLLRARLLYLARRLLVVWLVVAATLLGSFLFLKQQRTVIDKQLAAHQLENGSRDDQIKRINELMGAVARWVADHGTWSPWLADVVKAAPSAVRLEVLTVQGGGNSLLVKGVTSSRTAVVDMQRQLEALPWVASLEAPLQNFAAGAKSEFSFTLQRGEKSDETPQP